jgi:hypothetical protein
MLNRWLSLSRRPPESFDRFQVTDILELAAPGDVGVLDHLRLLAQDALVGLEFLAFAAQRLRWTTIADLVAEVTPNVLRFRLGDFGEILSYGVLEQVLGYVVPARKLRLKLQGDQTLPGTDAIALKASEAGALTEVCFVETKLRTGTDNDAAIEAYKQLEEDHAEHFASIVLFAAKEMQRSRHPLADPFVRYLEDRDQQKEIDSYHVVLVWDSATWRERVLGRLEEEEPQLNPLTVHALRIADLRTLADQVMAMLGVRVENDG